MNKNATASDETKLCMCFDFSLEDMKSIISNEPKISFEALLEKSNAGSKCTACLLDLEHYFVNLPRENTGAPETQKKSSKRQNKSIRHKIYGFLDDLSPTRAISLLDDVPVLCGENLEQWLWLANYELLYANNSKSGVPDFDVELKLFDADGEQIYYDNINLNLGNEWHGEISQHLRSAFRSSAKENTSPLQIGRLEITRKAKYSGVRGTTRPQIELVTPVSNCAVHGQAAGYNDGGSISLLCRPDDERIFLSFLNPSAAPVQLNIQYVPLSAKRNMDFRERTIPLNLPAKGARLHEVVFNNDEIREFSDTLLGVTWMGSGIYKCHGIIASPNLDRFSIDHL